MNGSLQRVLVALFALAFVLAACSSGSGVEWTPAPTDDQETPSEPAASADPQESTEPQESADPQESTEPEESADPQESAGPEESTEPEESATPPSGEARVIDLQADSALRFTDVTGQPVPDIPVTPGETIVFRVENTAGFAHNMYIGTDAELSVPSATTDIGIAEWSTGVEEFEWVVPDDVSGLKFACTVPGHYFSMQGTFSAAEPSEPATPEEPAEPEAPTDDGEPAAPEEPAEVEGSAEPEEPSEPVEPAAIAEPAEVAAASEGEPRIIELEADPANRFLQDGEQILDIQVTPGEAVLFRIDNTAGFPHNFYIGADSALQVPAGTTDVGIPDWETGVQELAWEVSADLTDLRFACTVPGHYYLMQGDFTLTA